MVLFGVSTNRPLATRQPQKDKILAFLPVTLLKIFSLTNECKETMLWNKTAVRAGW